MFAPCLSTTTACLKQAGMCPSATADQATIQTQNSTSSQTILKSPTVIPPCPGVVSATLGPTKAQ
jgi:hypothetical protein